jgi:hypothetical protein
LGKLCGVIKVSCAAVGSQLWDKSRDDSLRGQAARGAWHASTFVTSSMGPSTRLGRYRCRS